MQEVIRHYDALIDEDNDPVHDPEPLRAYMDGWDGPAFIDAMQLNPRKSVLEIGVGTGRLAVRTAPLCKTFWGVDISPKTIRRAQENLRSMPNVTLICADFAAWETKQRFDVIYSSLTFMHFQDKQAAIRKICALLNPDGRFVLSIDKNQSSVIDMGTRQVGIHPDDPSVILRCLATAGLILIHQQETAFAHLFVAEKPESEVNP